MKIKHLIFHIVLSLMVLYVVASYTQSLVLSHAFSLAIIFYALSVVAALAAPRLVSFLLLPRTLPFNILSHSILLYVVIYVCHSFLGGVTVHFLQFPSFEFVGIKVIGTSLGLFGTIAVGAVLIGLIYQILIWLNEHK